LQTLNYLNRLASHGVGYRSFTEQYFDSCGIFKDAVIAIMATVAKQERIRISERTKAGLEAAKRKGVPLGRRRVRIDGALVRQLQAEGKSFEEIAKQLKCGVGTASVPRRLLRSLCVKPLRLLFSLVSYPVRFPCFPSIRRKRLLEVRRIRCDA
jgi:DNA invertase Pin-like site-specific DNA recombinase